MRRIILKKDGKSIPSEMKDIYKTFNYKTYLATKEIRDIPVDLYVIYFHFEIDGKHVYALYAEPCVYKIYEADSGKYAALNIKEMNLQVLVEARTPQATWRGYIISSQQAEDDVMMAYMLNYFVPIDEYLIEEKDHILSID